jgi:succinate dehydrogenase / fumarate reductase iron-sulfur subunit
MKTINITLKVWRQENADSKGGFVDYKLTDIDTDMSFLEMLDVLNEGLTLSGDDPLAFDSDCREGICGMCGAVVNGNPHGPVDAVTICQLHMRSFTDGQTLIIEPWRSKAFPVVKDVVVDRSAFDRIIQAGGYVSVKTGAVTDANANLIPNKIAEDAMDAAQCIGCGACVAACPNASAMLFVGAKISHLSLLPQGKQECTQRVRKMVAQMDKEGFGSCSNEYECAVSCPKEINISHIARMNRKFIKATIESVTG